MVRMQCGFCVGLAGFVVACGAEVAPDAGLVVYDAVQIEDTARYDLALDGVERIVDVTVLDDGRQWVRIGDDAGPTLGAMIDAGAVAYVDLVSTVATGVPQACADAVTCGASPVDLALVDRVVAGDLPAPDRSEAAPSYRARPIKGVDACWDACDGDPDCWGLCV
ncbi:MAG: hypothetical protein ABMB14_32950, partial [Myxococcota bacterium]